MIPLKVGEVSFADPPMERPAGPRGREPERDSFFGRVQHRERCGNITLRKFAHFAPSNRLG
jgi:hypothetical protein